MGERKVVNKYYPADFDPAKIPRRRQPKNQQVSVRMMLPMSVRCGTCGSYLYKGTKFNSRKEDAVGDAYLGIQIIRFYFKCTHCSAEITYLTDPHNSDYAVESGASRNFEPWRAVAVAEEGDRNKRKLAEEMGDAMKSLENVVNLEGEEVIGEGSGEKLDLGVDVVANPKLARGGGFGNELGIEGVGADRELGERVRGIESG